jgi:hypothetical protein
LPTKDKLCRFDETTMTKIDIYSRAFDWHMNTLIETAVIEKVDRLAKERGIAWNRFSRYASIPGALLCAMFACDDLLNSWSANEEQLRQFVGEHEPFFYTDDGKPNTRNIRRLWPKIEIYVKLWSEDGDAWAAWRAMSLELERAHLAPPQIPQTPGVQPIARRT